MGIFLSAIARSIVRIMVLPVATGARKNHSPLAGWQGDDRQGGVRRTGGHVEVSGDTREVRPCWGGESCLAEMFWRAVGYADYSLTLEILAKNE